MPRCTRCEYNLSEGLVACPKCGHRNANTTSTGWNSNHLSSRHKAKSRACIDSTLPTTTPGQLRMYSHSHVTVSTPPRPSAQYKQEKLSKVHIVGILLLTLLLIASGITFLYYTLVAHPAQLRIKATETAQRIETTQVYATSVAQKRAIDIAQAKATTQAQANATEQAQAIAQARATARALQNIYTSSTVGRPTRSSSLTYETGFHWDIYPTRDDGGCAFNDNAYHSIVNTRHYYAPCLASDTYYGNLAIEVQMTILKGDEGGIIFHADAKSKGFYSFRIRRDGTYNLTLTRGNGHTLPLISESSNLIKTGTGKTNTLSVVTCGSNIYLYINHHYVGSASDSTYSSGSIGVIAINHQHKTDVAFTNLRIWVH